MKDNVSAIRRGMMSGAGLVALCCVPAAWNAGCAGADPSADPVESVERELTSADLWYSDLAAENGSFFLGDGGGYVRFGANGTWLWKYLPRGSASCTRSTFGGDPVPGVPKHCWFAPFGNPVAQNSTGSAYNHFIAYGRDGMFYFRKIGGNYTCNDTTFGGSPISGTKACYTALPAYDLIAAENETFDLGASTYPVAYGANGNWTHAALTGTVSCSNSTFGEQLYGTQKFCYILNAYKVADENGSFNLGSSSCTVYYMSEAKPWDMFGNKISKQITSGNCTTSQFGADPQYGYPKQCWAHCTVIP